MRISLCFVLVVLVGIALVEHGESTRYQRIRKAGKTTNRPNRNSKEKSRETTSEEESSEEDRRRRPWKKPEKCSCEAESKCKWEPIFRAVSGNGRNVFTDYVKGPPLNENDTDPASLEPFRSPLIDEWSQHIITNVRLEVFDEGEVKACFIFDAAGSTNIDWFSQSRLMSSPYLTLKTEEIDIFSIPGDESRNIRFQINSDDCDNCGYFAVVDKDGRGCPFTCDGPTPIFYYSDKRANCIPFEGDNSNCVLTGIRADVVFVIDGSDSVALENFNLQLDVAKNLVSKFDIGTDKTRVGLFSWSTTVNTTFNLNTHFSSTDVIDAIDSTIRQSAKSRIDLAVEHVHTSMFTEVNGDRPDVQDIVIFFSDGGIALNATYSDPYNLNNFKTIGVAAERQKAKGFLDMITPGNCDSSLFVLEWDQLPDLEPIICQALVEEFPGGAPKAERFAISARICDKDFV